MGKAEWVLGAVLLSTVITALATSHFGGKPDNLLFHYQTLITGLLALVSAMTAVQHVREQIRQTGELDTLRRDQEKRLEDERRELEKQRVEGQREAARTWLSLHVSAIIRYADGMGKGVWSLIQQCHEEALPREAKMPGFPSLPMEAAIAVKDFAKFADRNEAKFLAMMFSTMQVLDSRINSMINEPGGKSLSNLESYLEDAAELHARAEALLGHARHNTQEFPEGATWQRFSAAMFLITHRHEPTKRIAARVKKGAGGDMKSFLPNRFERDAE